MEKLTVTEPESDVTVEVSIDRIETELSEQGILGEDVENREFAYLAAIALGTWDDERYDIRATLMEFLRNSSEFDDLSYEDCDEIEAILR